MYHLYDHELLILHSVFKLRNKIRKSEENKNLITNDALLGMESTQESTGHAAWMSGALLPSPPSSVQLFSKETPGFGWQKPDFKNGGFIWPTETEVQECVNKVHEHQDEDQLSLLSSRSSIMNIGSLVEGESGSTNSEPKKLSMRNSDWEKSFAHHISVPQNPIPIGRPRSIISIVSDPAQKLRHRNHSSTVTAQNMKQQHRIEVMSQSIEARVKSYRGVLHDTTFRQHQPRNRSGNKTSPSENSASCAAVSKVLQESRRRRAERAGRSTPLYNRYRFKERQKLWSAIQK